MPKQRVLFLCSHNSARSQMAEGILRAWGGDRYEPHSAGTEATSVRPEAISAMAELGIDIGGQESKAVQRYSGAAFDIAVTVCEDANEACPYFPAKRNLHWGFDDPAAVDGTEDERLAAFRRVRDEIATRIRGELLDRP
ncbi:MAG TPA: arsenate reductase ArsC [Candidatus Limnocylindrales bacterium]